MRPQVPSTWGFFLAIDQATNQKFHNGVVMDRLLLARKTLGFNKLRMSKYCGLSPQGYGRIENRITSPWIKQEGRWSSTATQIAKALCMLEEDLWPEFYIQAERDRLRYEREAYKAFYQSQSNNTPEQIALRNEARSQIYRALRTLSPQEEKTILLRYGFGDEENPSRQTIGAFFDLHGERVRQIECKALRRLRHPSRAKNLLTLWEAGDPGLG